jgi:6-phosphogluconolactonase
MAPEIERKLIVAQDFVTIAVAQILAAAPRDERCVAPDHPDSNFRMAQESLLGKVPARVLRMPGDKCDPSAYEREIEAVLGQGLPVFDLVILGLGQDGHTASLFPGDPAMEIQDRWVARVNRPDHARLTLTLPVLSAAKTALFLVSGKEKQAAVHDLVGGTDSPAARVAARRVVIVADEAAAGGLGEYSKR